MEKLIIYTDGASRGNPGPAGAGMVFVNKRGDVIEKFCKFLGKKTNNEAEYEAVILALKKFKALYSKKKAKKTEVEIRTDSELVAKQMNGRYKIENENLQKIFMKLWNLRLDFKEVKIKHVPREKNHEADALANQALDKEINQKELFL